MARNAGEFALQEVGLGGLAQTEVRNGSIVPETPVAFQNRARVVQCSVEELDGVVDVD
jgi:hypothetical protein